MKEETMVFTIVTASSAEKEILNS